MNSPEDESRAWQFVRGFDVPPLTDQRRQEWRGLIKILSVEQFQRGCREARRRPENQLHLRPSPEAFLAYSTRSMASYYPAHEMYDTWKPGDADREAMTKVLEDYRSKKENA